MNPPFLLVTVPGRSAVHLFHPGTWRVVCGISASVAPSDEIGPRCHNCYRIAVERWYPERRGMDR